MKHDDQAELTEALLLTKGIFHGLAAAPQEPQGNAVNIALTFDTPYEASSPLVIQIAFEALALKYEALCDALQPARRGTRPGCLISWEADDDESPTILSAIKIECSFATQESISNAQNSLNIGEDELFSLCAIAKEALCVTPQNQNLWKKDDKPDATQPELTPAQQARMNGPINIPPADKRVVFQSREAQRMRVVGQSRGPRI